MAINTVENSFVGSSGQTISLAAMFGVTASASNPTYLVLTGLDRNEYTAGASGATGTLSGNGHSEGFTSIGGDGRGIDVVFTYQASTGRYLSSTYGYLDQMTYTASTSNGDVTNLSLYGTNSLSLANSFGNNAYSMAQVDASGYIASATVVTQPGFTGTVPVQATPDSMCATAESFVGKAWNENGCWVLASTIAAEAGASLPVESSMVGIGGQANGEWIVAFNGATQTGNWESLVKAGEVVVIGNATSGHVTTCVSGSGSSAMLIDNITYVYSNGTVANPANDGSSSDVLVSAAHAASQEWTGVVSGDVVIYELDAPIVSDLVSTDSLATNAKQSLALLFSAVDPANKTLTEYQVYDSATGDSFVVNGATESAHTASGAITVASLAAISLQAGTAAATDTVEVRAYNGSYWGDWETLRVSVSGTVTAAKAPSAPTVANQTAAQTWTQGEHVSLALSANTFVDPNGQTLKFTATESNGQALPSWLSFSATTDTFTGIVPNAAASLSLKVTATDTSGLSTSETIAVTVPAVAPVATLKLATQTATQNWTDGENLSFALPASTFSDAAGAHITYSAYELNGTPLTSWLTFNSTTDTFGGKVPTNASGSATLEVVATDSNGGSATDIFSVILGKSGTTASLVGVMTMPEHGIHAIHA